MTLSRQYRRDDDLGAPQLPLIAWEKGRESLAELYAWVEVFATEAICWYMSEKNRKARWSKGLRALSAILATVGGAIPVAALSAGKPVLGNWGFVLLALAAGCLAYDRFFGYSSAWLRYMSAAMSLRSQLIDFQLGWVKAMADMSGREPSSEEIGIQVDSVLSFVRDVNETIRNETQSWLVEFKTNLSELESTLRQSPSAQAPSGTDAVAVDKKSGFINRSDRFPAR